MISVSEALRIIVANRANYSITSLSLRDALGTVCASDIKAKLTQPPFDASAMDGYAVKISDVFRKGAILTVIGEAPAGAPFEGVINAGQAVRIFTGSPVPKGADTIIIQEDVKRLGETIAVNVPSDVSKHIRRAGIDFEKNATLVKTGKIIEPADIALAAAGNHSGIKTFKRPIVAIIANGDELCAPGAEIGNGQIVSSNPAALTALISHWGGIPLELGIAKDNLQSIRSLIEKARKADIIVPVGGASVGDYDYMRQAFADAGFESLFEKIAVRPGKPTWFGKLGKQCVLGLPGNPASAIVCAHLFLKPLMGRADEITLTPVRLADNLAANGSRETFLRGRLYIDDAGFVTAMPFPRQDSSLMTPLATSNALIQLPVNSGPWSKGDTIRAMPLGVGPDIL